MNTWQGKIPAWLAPLLFAVFFSIDCYLELWPFGTVRGLALTLVCASAFALAVYGGLRAVLRQANKASAGTIVVLLCTYFFSSLYQAWNRLSIYRFATPRCFLVLVAAGVFVALLLIWRTRRALTRFVAFATVTTLLLCLYSAARAVLPVKSAAAAALPQAPAPTSALRATERPDIYFILLDGHTSAESLVRFWGHDESAFVEQLRTTGFTVVSNAQGNFDSTTYCTATTLNMSYVAVSQGGGASAAAYRGAVNQISRSAVAGALQRIGYDVMNYSIFPLAEREPFYRHASIVATKVPGLALMRTPLGHIARAYWVRQQGRAGLDILRRVEELAGTPGPAPRFVYAHVLLPHAPYFYDRNGREVGKGLSPADQVTRKSDYLEQLIYVDRVITNTVAKILARSSRPPVIIIQGDHGFRSLEGRAKSEEALTILNAMYLPNGRSNVVPHAGITPVNTFRLVFNKYFDASLPMLPDHGTLLGVEYELGR